MSPAIDFNSTSKQPVDEMNNLRQVVEVRAATDITSPIELLVEMEEADFRNVTAAVSRTGIMGIYGLTAPLHDPWLLDTVVTLASFRAVRDGWDGLEAVAPERGSLETAEMLAAHFANLTVRLRPTVTVDTLGRPTFSMNEPDLYLHLTIDAPGKLTWFAEIGGTEHFADDIGFDGRQIPEALRKILPFNA